MYEVLLSKTIERRCIKAISSLVKSEYCCLIVMNNILIQLNKDNATFICDFSNFKKYSYKELFNYKSYINFLSISLKNFLKINNLKKAQIFIILNYDFFYEYKVAGIFINDFSLNNYNKKNITFLFKENNLNKKDFICKFYDNKKYFFYINKYFYNKLKKINKSCKIYSIYLEPMFYEKLDLQYIIGKITTNNIVFYEYVDQNFVGYKNFTYLTNKKEINNNYIVAEINNFIANKTIYFISDELFDIDLNIFNGNIKKISFLNKELLKKCYNLKDFSNYDYNNNLKLINLVFLIYLTISSIFIYNYKNIINENNTYIEQLQDNLNSLNEKINKNNELINTNIDQIKISNIMNVIKIKIEENDITINNIFYYDNYMYLQGVSSNYSNIVNFFNDLSTANELNNLSIDYINNSETKEFEIKFNINQ